MSETTTENVQDNVQEVTPNSQNETNETPDVNSFIAESKKYRSRAQLAESELSDLKSKLEKQEEERLAKEKELAEPLEDLDLDVMWENTVWNEIEDIAESVSYETEYITAVAGVRGAEAEDEALALLYYRKSMKGLSKLDIQKALGKLIMKREKMDEDNPNIKKIDGFILQLRNKLKSA